VAAYTKSNRAAPQKSADARLLKALRGRFKPRTPNRLVRMGCVI
jgi:hypothetical protein